MSSNQNVKKPADTNKDDREEAQGDDVIGTPHGHTNKAMGNAANPGQQQKDNAGTGQQAKNKSRDEKNDKNKSKDAGGHDKHQGSGGSQHKN